MIRGNLLAIPIEDSVLYAEPLYLRAEKGEIPQLRRVIVSDGANLTMDTNLERALRRLFDRPVDEKSETMLQEGVTLNDFIKNAIKYYMEAKDASREGDWALYGQRLNQLEETLEILKDFVEQDELQELQDIFEER